MEHNFEIKCVEKTSKEGKKYLEVYGVVDGLLNLRFDNRLENTWAFIDLIKSGDKVNVIGRTIEYNRK